MSAIRITFLGAAGTVTGSKYLIEYEKKKLLVDCGLFQGHKDLRLRNWRKLPVTPSEIDAVILTHAHIDHTGYLPRLVKDGFKGPIYGTPATIEFTKILLLDSAHLQEEDAAYFNKLGTSKHKPALPLYDEQDAQKVLPLLKAYPPIENFQVLPGWNLRQVVAGHILGAMSLLLEVGGRLLTFSGDIGRYGVPILQDPGAVEIGDLLICESTYGDRLHAADQGDAELAGAIKNSIARGGPLIIPAFALGRTQHLLYAISKLESEGKIPVVPVFVDSPMAVESTQIYRKYSEQFDSEALALMNRGKDPLEPKALQFSKTKDQSKRLNSLEGPRIIISASGMATGGRVLHHLKNWLPHPETTVLFVGYQAAGSRGEIIQSGEREVKIFGINVPVRAHVETISSLSAHADKNELLRWAKSAHGTPRYTRIVHGEPAAISAFSSTLKTNLGWDACAAEDLEVLEIN